MVKSGAPPHLSASSKRLYRRLVSDYGLDRGETIDLEHAAEGVSFFG
jgi:hypothetical protein